MKKKVKKKLTVKKSPPKLVSRASVRRMFGAPVKPKKVAPREDERPVKKKKAPAPKARGIMNLKVNDSERARINVFAKRYAGGNVSSYLRQVALRLKLKPTAAKPKAKTDLTW